MNDSTGIEEQKLIINEIISLMVSNNKQNNFFLLKGPSGSGKSYIVESIAKYWEGLESDNSSIYLSGDIGHCERPYFPFVDAIDNLRKRHIGDIVIKGSSELVKGIPFAGDFVSYLIETIAGSKSAKKQEALKYLSEIEQLLLINIDKHIRSGKCIIIADNIHWWDNASLSLLHLIIEGKLNEEFFSFNQLQFICVFTDDQESVSPKEVDKILSDNRFIQFFTRLVSEKNYLRTLNLFGFQGTLDKELVHLLHSITGGHLLLLKRLSEYLSDPLKKQHIEDSIADSSKVEWRNDFMEDLFAFRLRLLGVQQSEVIKVLEYAAIIGVSFKSEELLCISKEDEIILTNIINEARKSNLITGDFKNTNFAHDIIRDFFLARLKERRFAYNKQFAECLRILRPSDYYTRANHLFASGNVADSLILYMLGYFKNLRDGSIPSPVIVNRIELLSDEYNLLEVYHSITKAYKLFFESDFSQALDILVNIEDVYSKKISAEKYYLLALCLSRSMENQSFKDALECLDGWDELKVEESEIWLRIQSTRLIMHCHLYEFDKARMVEKEIMLYLVERVKFDPSSADNINIIRRKSGSLHITDIAVERSRKSVEYFSATTLNGYLKNPVQFFMAANNHAGNLLVSGEFNSSFNIAKAAIDILATHKDFIFPKPFIPANNYIISGLLSKNFSENDALEMYNAIVDKLDGQADKLLIENNIAVTYCLSNQLKIANSVLKKAYETIQKKQELDNYYCYYVISNFACVSYLLGDKDKACSLWASLIDKIPKIPEINYLVRRHELIADSFLSLEIRDPVIWQEHLLKSNPFELGKSWSFFGKGFLYSDLQFWSES